jgi:predicted Rossmann fold flavoprotein
MAQERKSKVAIVGGGPAGCMCAYFLQNKFDVTVFEKKSPLYTLLPTGGGRCNLANAIYDFKELASNYPRGEKFLYSVFSKFSTSDTLDFFEKIGVKTYIQDDMRIFPISNSSKDVREKFLKALNKVRFIKEEVLKINSLSRFSIFTSNNSYDFDYVVVAIGGHCAIEILKSLGHNVIQQKPALTGLETKEDFSKLSGVSINGVLFTHKGVSGPEIYKISSLKARENFPYKLNFDFAGKIDLQEMLNCNPHKSIKNLMSEIVPKSFAEFVLQDLNIVPDCKCHAIDGKTRDCILNKLQNFEITVNGTVPDGEVVMSGGVDLNEINPKTMESKLIPNLYLCGEVLNIDGFCGGFNLQNCWSTAFVAADAIMR